MITLVRHASGDLASRPKLEIAHRVGRKQTTSKGVAERANSIVLCVFPRVETNLAKPEFLCTMPALSYDS